MPGIVSLVNAIGADVNAQLVAAGYPALVDGGIPIGQGYIDENSAPPRIVLVPRGAKFGPRSTPNRQAMATTNPLAQGGGVRAYQVTQYGAGYLNTDTVTIGAPDIAGGTQATAALVVSTNGAVVRVLPTVVGSGYLKSPSVTLNTSTGSNASATPVLAPTSENLSQLQQRAIFTDTQIFQCHVWGLTSGATGNQPSDFDAAQVLYQQLIASAWLLAPGIVRPLAGAWPESSPQAAQRDMLGHYMVFGLEIDTPLLDHPLAFAPAAVRPNLTENMQSPTGTIETGWSGLG